MNFNKIPISLIWQLFGKIFDDLDLEDLRTNYFTNLKVKPNNCYELIYGLILKLLSETQYLHKSYKYGVSDDLFGMNIDKTISNNTLYECKVYGMKYEYSWDCPEHRVFIQALKICEQNSDKSFTRQPVVHHIFTSFIEYSKIRYDLIDVDIDRALASLRLEYDAENDDLFDSSLMMRKRGIYLNLCRLSNLVLVSESTSTDILGSLGLNYNKIDWFIIQQYGVREIWNVINRQKELTGKKHRNFQPTIYNGNSASLKPDAVYIFDNLPIRDTIVDIKLYHTSCLDSYNKYRFSNIANQLLTYKVAYPKYISSYKEKCSRKNISYLDVNTWAVHFRRGISKEELAFSGTKIFQGFGDIGIYMINMFDDCTIKDLDEQIEQFVMKCILK